MSTGKETFSTVPLLHEGEGLFNDSIINFDIFTLIENMKHEQSWLRGELNSQILLKNLTKKIVLTLIHEGTEIRSFQSNDSTTYQVLEGKLKFHIRNKFLILIIGKLLTLNKKIKYSFKSEEETAFILTSYEK